MDVVNVELVDVRHVRAASLRDPDTGKYADPIRASRLSAQYVYLYDPPRADGIVRDGAGNPMRSYILASTLNKALELGFTEEPPGEESDELEEMTVPELRDLADERGVELSSDMRKADIIEALESTPDA